MTTLALGVMALVLVLTGAASWPLALGALGVLLNAAVALVNGGRMPVIGGSEGRLLSNASSHVLANSSHRLLLLADRIPVGPLRASPGDVLLTLGVAMPVLMYLL